MLGADGDVNGGRPSAWPRGPLPLDTRAVLRQSMFLDAATDLPALPPAGTGVLLHAPASTRHGRPSGVPPAPAGAASSHRNGADGAPGAAQLGAPRRSRLRRRSANRGLGGSAGHVPPVPGATRARRRDAGA